MKKKLIESVLRIKSLMNLNEQSFEVPKDLLKTKNENEVQPVSSSEIKSLEIPIELLKTLEKNPQIFPPLEKITKVSSFGDPRSIGPHPGVDLAAKSGTNVFSPGQGVVIDSKEYDNIMNYGCGGMVFIRHAGYKTRYCHLKKVNVSKGQMVSRGQTIGLSGGGSNDNGAGWSEGPHLHFELYLDKGGLTDPWPYLVGEKKISPDIVFPAKTEKEVEYEDKKYSDLVILISDIIWNSVSKWGTTENAFFRAIELIPDKETLKKIDEYLQKNRGQSFYSIVNEPFEFEDDEKENIVKILNSKNIPHILNSDGDIQSK